VSRHWRPEGKVIRLRPVGRRKWTRVDAYGFRPETNDSNGTGPWFATIALTAILIGLVAGGILTRTARDTISKAPSSDIHWNEVQAVPKRAPDAADIEWEKRAKEQDDPSTSSGRTATAEEGLPVVIRGHSEETKSIVPQKIYVIDGDTFSLGNARIRIAGIDAPEMHPPRCEQEARLGLAAQDKLRQLLSSGSVTISGTIHDRYGREVRNVQVNGQDVGEAMISAGVARKYGSGRRPWC